MPQNDTDKKGQRIAKFMAAAGLCSRREAERWITDGHVKVNGVRIDSPALNVTEDDSVMVKGDVVKISSKKPRLFRLNKPRGYICTNIDPEGRKTVFELIPKGLPRLISVGRLDLDSEGVILFTDTPSLADKMMKPSAKIERIYRVRIDGNLSLDQVKALEKGVKHEGIQYQGVKVQVEGEQTGRNSWIILTLTEGKNREIRNIMRAIGLNVSRLKRTSYGGFELGKLPRGLVDEVPYAVSKAVLKTMDIEI
ncbi:MAG: 23S rRNA pseudouridine2605 synthase [Alphaproteobacteria bacterium]|jgi:23S rRNA pseudouridine2605 synthase